MKLLLLSTSSSRNAGGLYNSVRNLGQELYTQGNIDPLVLAYNDNKSELDIAAYAPLPIEEYHIIGPSGIAFSLDLKAKIKSIRPDLIHIQGIYLYSSYINKVYSTQNNIPYLVSPRGMLDKWILSTRPIKKKIGFFLYESAHLANAKCIHALGYPEYRSIRDFGLDKPVAIIPNGVFLPKEDVEDLEPPFWKKDNRKVLLFLSRLHKKKGIENLMQAWNVLGNEKKDWKIVIAGESNGTEYFESLLQLQSQLGLQNDVFFIGPKFHSEKDSTFRFADAFVLPSYSEGMPMAILEAWSYKLPVLMTEECNLPEGFSHNAALRIEANEISIIEGLKKLFSMSSFSVKEMGTNGYNLVKCKYTWSSIAVEMTNVYNWMLDDSLTPPSSIKFD